MTAVSRPQLLALPVGLLALVIGAALGWAARYMVIEPEPLHALCEALVPPAWCAMRDALIALTFPPHYGEVGVALAVMAWFTRGRAAMALAVTGLFVGGLGLYLYDPGWATSATLAALLRLPRVGEEPDDPREFAA